MSGQIELQLFCGDSITSDLARVAISSCADVNADCKKIVDIWCAIVRGLHGELILTYEAADCLHECS